MWWNGNLGGGTPDTGSGPFRLNFIAAYRPIRFGCGWGCPLPGSAKRRESKRFYDIPLTLDSVAYESNKK